MQCFTNRQTKVCLSVCLYVCQSPCLSAYTCIPSTRSASQTVHSACQPCIANFCFVYAVCFCFPCVSHASSLLLFFSCTWILGAWQYFYPDGGWGWIICGVSFLVHILTTGLQLSYGLLLFYAVDHLHKTSGIGKCFRVFVMPRMLSRNCLHSTRLATTRLASTACWACQDRMLAGCRPVCRQDVCECEKTLDYSANCMCSQNEGRPARPRPRLRTRLPHADFVY